MGAANVGAVLIYWPGHVSQRSMLVLVAMAHLSLDTAREAQAARRYFAGPGYLAEVLYGPEGIAHAQGGEAVPTDSAGRQVRKCLTELERAGAIRRVVKGAPGRRSEYEVVLTRADVHTPVDDDSRPADLDRRGPSTPDLSGPEQRTAEVRSRGPVESPSGTTRNHQEHEEEKIAVVSTSPAPALAASEQGWTDVALVVEQVTGEQYDGATAHLERTVGTAQAGDLTAAYLLAHEGAGYMDAVVHVARESGWKA